MNLRKLKQRKVQLDALKDISGKYILLTGRIPKYTRTTIEKRITDLGGRIVAKATSSVDICVYTRKDTDKYRTAKNIKDSCKTNMVFVDGDEFVKEFLKLED